MKLPDTPKMSYWLQQLYWIADPIGYMNMATKHCGDMFTAKVIGKADHLVFVSHPEAIQQILTKDNRELSAPGEDTNAMLKPLVGDYSLFLLQGDSHKRRRKLLMPPFHGERMRSYGQLICEITKQVMSQLSLENSFTARTVAQEISLKIILQAVFGIYEGERYQTLAKLLGNMLELFNHPIASSFLFFQILQQDWGPWSPWGNFIRQRQQIDNLLYTEIAERRQHPDPDRTDILSLLMSARDEGGNALTDQELRDELLTILFAGHETTATAMSWALYWVHHHPEIREKVLEELQSLDRPSAPLEIAKLPYLTAVCKETLRIHPVGMLTFPRKVEVPLKIQGHHFEPNSMLVGCIYLTHQREDLYPEPHKFKPERFLERQYSAYEYVPFGGGVRRCIGYALAELEMKLVLGTVLSGYHLELAESKPIKPQRRGVTLSPKGGVKMIFKGERTLSEQKVKAVVGASS